MSSEHHLELINCDLMFEWLNFDESGCCGNSAAVSTAVYGGCASFWTAGTTGLESGGCGDDFRGFWTKFLRCFTSVAELLAAARWWCCCWRRRKEKGKK